MEIIEKTREEDEDLLEHSANALEVSFSKGGSGGNHRAD
jgi:hypothetical protein